MFRTASFVTKSVSNLEPINKSPIKHCVVTMDVEVFRPKRELLEVPSLWFWQGLANQFKIKERENIAKKFQFIDCPACKCTVSITEHGDGSTFGSPSLISF